MYEFDVTLSQLRRIETIEETDMSLGKIVFRNENYVKYDGLFGRMQDDVSGYACSAKAVIVVL